MAGLVIDQNRPLGRLNSALAPLVNWGLGQKWVRSLMQMVLGVHQERQVLHYQQETFARWWGRRPSRNAGATGKKVALFASCLVNYQATDVGKATVQVLEKTVFTWCCQISPVAGCPPLISVIRPRW